MGDGARAVGVGRWCLLLGVNLCRYAKHSLLIHGSNTADRRWQNHEMVWYKNRR